MPKALATSTFSRLTAFWRPPHIFRTARKNVSMTCYICYIWYIMLWCSIKYVITLFSCYDKNISMISLCLNVCIPVYVATSRKRKKTDSIWWTGGACQRIIRSRRRYGAYLCAFSHLSVLNVIRKIADARNWAYCWNHWYRVYLYESTLRVKF